MSQNLVESYLLEHLEDEYEKYKIRCENIKKKQKQKKKTRTPESLRDELERLNNLYQKGRITWDYYNEEYDRIEKELNVLSFVPPEEECDYSFLEELLKTDFKDIYKNLSLQNRQAFWRSIIREICLNEDNTIKGVDFL